MYVLVEDFECLTMRVLNKAGVKFYNTDNYYNGCGEKARYRFEYNE